MSRRFEGCALSGGRKRRDCHVRQPVLHRAVQEEERPVQRPRRPHLVAVRPGEGRGQGPLQVNPQEDPESDRQGQADGAAGRQAVLQASPRRLCSPVGRSVVLPHAPSLQVR